MEHKIRSKSGSTALIKKYGRNKAIKLQCTECSGFGEFHPKDCTDKLCPLFPFRGKCQAGYANEVLKQVEKDHGPQP